MNKWTVPMALFAAGLAASGAVAETLTDAECRRLDARIRVDVPSLLIPLDDLPPLRAAEDGCRTGAMELKTSGSDHIITLIDDIVLDGVALRAYAETGAPPEKASLRLDGFRVDPRTGDPAMDFAFAVQNARRGVRGRLAIAFDRASNRFVLEEASLDFPGANGVVVSAEAEGVDSSSRDALRASMATAKLVSARIEVASRGLSESYLLMPLAPVILAGADDAALAFEAWKTALRDRIFSKPDATLPPPSKQALGRLLQDLPNPYGRLVIELSYPGGFGLPEAMALGEARLAQPEEWVAAPLIAEIEYFREDPDAAQ